MTPDVVVDVGNSRIKWGRCESGGVTENTSLPPDTPDAWAALRATWKLPTRARWVVAGVNPPVQARFVAWVGSTQDEIVEISDYRQVALVVGTDRPAAVGIDRLLTALAAHRTARPRPAVVLNIGTAVTGDVVDGAGTFLGGAIFPGPHLMARSLHEHTAKLPLIDVSELDTVSCPGTDTRSAIALGIASAVGGAIVRLINSYTDILDAPPLVFFTGGGMGPYTDVEMDQMWTPDPDDTRFVPTLTLEGIRLAAEALP